MKVLTGTEQLQEVRNGVLELTAGMLPNVDKSAFRELSTAMSTSSTSPNVWQGRDRQKTDSSNPIFDISMDSCILCGRCAQACQAGHQFIGAIDVLGTGTKARIGTFMDQPLLDSVCTTCGQCLSVCPTGAISTKETPKTIVKTVKTTCPYCGVGCGIQAGVDEGDVIQEMLDDPDNLSSIGMLCVKGRFGYTFVHHEDRLTSPLVR